MFQRLFLSFLMLELPICDGIIKKINNIEETPQNTVRKKIEYFSENNPPRKKVLADP